MKVEEAFSTYTSRLIPLIPEQVAAHIQGYLESATTMAQRIKIFHSGAGDGSKAKGSQMKNTRKGKTAKIEGSTSEESSMVEAIQG